MHKLLFKEHGLALMSKMFLLAMFGHNEMHSRGEINPSETTSMDQDFFCVRAFSCTGKFPSHHGPFGGNVEIEFWKG